MGSFQLFFFFIFFTLEPSRCIGSCLTGCGSCIIRFPFRLIGQPQHCGYSGFNLSCRFQETTAAAVRELPVLTLPNVGNFNVYEIDYTLQILRTQYSQGCLSSILLQGLNLSGSPFKQAFAHTYIFYNCTIDATVVVYYGVVQIPCLSGLSFYVAAVRSDVNDYIPATAKETCMEIATVSAPYSGTELLDDLITLGWTEPDCRWCENHKGITVNVKYGLLFGLGTPLVCIVAIVSCFRISLSERQNHSVSDADILMTSVTGRGATNGLDRETIDTYPTTSLGPNRRLPNPNDNVCSICLFEYEANELLKAIPNCNHYFHVDCIDQWLKLNATCPICRDKHVL